MNLRGLLADGSWSESRRASAGLLIGATTFGILALELALIRWTSGQVRAFAYFNNVVLIAAFLGMGAGVALGRRWPGLLHLTLPLLALLALPLAMSEELGLVRLTFPDRTVTLWGAEMVEGNAWLFTRNLTIFLALLTAVGAVFTAAGAALGHLFGRLAVLRAYAADLAGSLVGIVAFTATAWCEAGPAVWLTLGVLPFAWLARRWWGLGLAVAIVGLAKYSEKDAQFSPYNRIGLERGALFLRLDVNREFHQYLHNLSDTRLRDPALTADDRAALTNLRELYDLPFVLNPKRGSALIVGAGTGNDVQAALRNRYARVTSVDIDGRIIAIGREHHPEQPYRDPRVTTVTNDARAFFEQHRDEQFDVVCYGLLDSHAMASAMSTLRLDNFVYTEEGVRAAWKHVAPGGHLSLAMACNAGQWFFERLYWTIGRATGYAPIAIYNPIHGGTITFVVPTPTAEIVAEELRKRQVTKPERPLERTLTLTDDWPFLYLRPNVFPWGYLMVLGFIATMATVTVRKVFGFGRGGPAFDWPLFLMGAAFLLIETRGVTSLSLLFGSTWIVNSVVFGGILTMVLLANLAVERWRWSNPLPWFCALFGAVALLYAFPMAWLQTLPLAGRALVGGLLTGLPVGLAGVIVPMLLARARDPGAALGANLLGAVLGGCLEYYSMFGGMRATALMALVLYLFAFLAVRRREAAAPAQGSS